MNWYKKHYLYKRSSVYGEFWIDESGNSLYADGDIGTEDHSSYVINRIISEKTNSEEIDYNYIVNLPNEKLISMGFDQEMINIIKGRKDPRSYAMKNWGWIRIADRFCQFWFLTPSILKNLGDGLYNCFGDEVFRQSNFVLEVLSNGAIYEPVPWLVIEKEDPMLLRQYLSDKFIFSSAKKMYKTFQIRKFLGYKIVGVKKDTKQAYSIYSKEPININIGTVEEHSGKGLFLGTSKDFCLDYYSCGTADEDDELLLTYEYNLQDIIQGDPNYKNGEIQVKKAILVNIEPVDKGRYG